MLVNDLKIISAPVVVVMDNTETEYDNGAAACVAVMPDNRLEVKALSVKDNKVVVHLAAWKPDNPFNFVGEAAII